MAAAISRLNFAYMLKSLMGKQCIYTNWKLSSVKCLSSLPDIKSSDIKITKCTTPKPKPTNVTNVEFGKIFTDHMLTMRWTEESGWESPEIKPYQNLSIDPAAKVLHYSLEGFEGMKAYRAQNGSIRLFRPMQNMERLLRTSRRLCLPVSTSAHKTKENYTFRYDTVEVEKGLNTWSNDTCSVKQEFNGEEFLKCMIELIKVDKDWIPEEDYCSLYIRPTIIGTAPALGVNLSNEALLYTILSPVGPYFKTGSFNPVTLMADPQFVRSWHGGSGDSKAGGNYGPTLLAQALAIKKNCEQVLWLYGEDQQVTEVGTMNIFILLENENGEEELITPPLDGLILPGITRMSLLDLAREWNEFKVSERIFTMNDLQKGLEKGKIKEVFGAGTACVICPIKAILYNEELIHIPTMENGPKLAKRFYDELCDIQYGRIPSPWSVVISD